MRANEPDDGEAEIVLDYELEAPPEKVWRAVAMPEFRDRWLPSGDLVDGEPRAVEPGRRISFAMREQDFPHAQSIVTFELRPSGTGGTRFRIVHSTAAPRSGGPLMAANCNRPPSLPMAA